MLRPSGNSPTQRGIADVPTRVARLEEFERWRIPTKIDFESIVGAAAYGEYWAEMDRVVTELEKSQLLADRLKSIIASTHEKLNARPLADSALVADTHCEE
jgi:hypothetical protein